MQKLMSLYRPGNQDLERFTIKELKDGWIVKQMTCVDNNLILLMEKESRKEKLDKLNEL